MRPNRVPSNRDDMYRLFAIILLAAFLFAAFGCAKPKDGKDGAPGAPGRVGDRGPAPVVSTQPASPLACPTGGTVVTLGTAHFVICNGLVGSVGAPGHNGTDGANGQDGQDGQDGADAAPVTVVSLCPGHTSYPGVFVEVALCLQNKLFGVYSANGGFLVELVPGYYYSNGIGSSCNLTVGPNCTVSH